MRETRVRPQLCFSFARYAELADPASGFRQTSALVASVKNCIHPSTAQRILLMTRDGISLSAEVLRLSQFRAISDDTVPILFPCFSFIDLPCVRTYFVRRFYLHHRCCRFVTLCSLSCTARRFALFAHQGFPLRARSHPSSEATKSRHLLRSSSSDYVATVTPFNIDEGIVGDGLHDTVSPCTFSVPTLNFVLFVIIHVIFACPQTMFFKNTFVNIKRL